MRIPLVGPSATLTSLAAAASECVNLYPELIDDPEDRQKNVGILKLVPGVHSFATLATNNVRGMWSGGGRLFVVSGAVLYEVASDGTVVNSNSLGANDGAPVQIFGNGNQLGIVANGYFYYDNGAGPVQARFLISGVADTVSGGAFATVNWVSGNQFTPEINGLVILLGDSAVTATYVSATQITVAPDVGTLSAQAFEAAAGDLVTAVTGAYLDGSAYVQRPQDPTTLVYGYSDLVIDAVTNTDITSVARPFNGADVGNTMIITGGTGFTPGTYTISAVLLGVATLSGAVGALGSTGGQGGEYTTATGADLGRQVNYSDPFDFTKWRGLNFFSKESGPDYIQSILAEADLLYLFGTETMEVWQNDPSTGNPVRIPGAAAQQGSGARWAPESLAQSVYFLGGSPNGQFIAYRLRGFTPERISTPAIEALLVAANSAIGYGYVNETGHQFWVVCCDSYALVYDATASAQFGYPVWHQRQRWVPSGGGSFNVYPYKFHTFVPEWLTGVHIVADANSAELLVMSESFYDDNGADIAWRRAVPYRYNSGKRIYFSRQTLEMETGTADAFVVASASAANPCVITKVAHGLQNNNTVAFSGATGSWTPLNGVNFLVTVLSPDTFSIPLNSTGFGALTGTVVLNPLVIRTRSDDRGHTFTFPEVAAMGAHDDFSRRVFWPVGGSSVGRVWRYFGVGQQKTTLIDLEAEETMGAV
jgi:hypothetical protein